MKLYKCIECGRKFETIDNVDNCIYCGSDNITPTKNISPLFLLPVVFLVCIGVGFGVSELISRKPSRKPSSVDIIKERIVSTDVFTVDSTAIPFIVSISEPKYSGGSFAFNVHAATKSNAKLDYLLYTLEDATLPYKSDNGEFVGVSPTEDGIYLLKVINVEVPEYSVEHTVSGFLKPTVQPIVKLTKSQIQKILDTQNPPAGLYLKFAEGYKLRFEGLDPGEPVPDRFDEILNRLLGCTWSAAEVIGEPVYDELNRITLLKIRVIY